VRGASSVLSRTFDPELPGCGTGGGTHGGFDVFELKWITGEKVAQNSRQINYQYSWLTFSQNWA